MDDTWDLTMDRTDPSVTRLASTVPLEPGPGQAVLRTEHVGLTANNVTYAVLGDVMRYWEFFPAPEGQGHVPLWGFAEVSASRADGLVEGDRVYGYLPTASHLLVTPGTVRQGGFRDTAEHRAPLAAVYNSYVPAQRGQDDLQVLFRPLFMTSFMLADWLADAGPAAEQVVLSSASSKTAYGTAFALRDTGARVVGLTSAGNVDFTNALGVYDEVLAYESVPELTEASTAYVDVAGSAPLRRAVHARLSEQVVRDVVVGIAQGQPGGDPGPLEGARPTMFFAPDQIAKRGQDWGPGGVDQKFGEAWGEFASWVAPQIDVLAGEGPGALETAWKAVVAGVGPRVGHVITFPQQ